MVKRVIKVSDEQPSDHVDGGGLTSAFAALRERLELPAQFGEQAEQEAEQARVAVRGVDAVLREVEREERERQGACARGSQKRVLCRCCVWTRSR